MTPTASSPSLSSRRTQLFVVLASTLLIGATVPIAVEQPATANTRDILAIVSK